MSRTLSILTVTVMMLSQTTYAATVKPPDVDKLKVTEKAQHTCITKPKVKKPNKPLYKKPKQTETPAPPEEKPCEITQHFYFDEVIYPDYLGKLPRHDFERVTRPNSEPYRWNWSAPKHWGGGFLHTVEREVIKTVYVTQPTPPIATPLPSAFWLFGSALCWFCLRRKN